MDNSNNRNIKVRKDYVEKISKKISNYDDAKPEYFNELLYILNFSFQTRNNFFIKNFDKKTLNTIYNGYNRIKSNILSHEIDDIFFDVEISAIKSFQFILSNLIRNFESIKIEYTTIKTQSPENTLFYAELWETINLQYLKHCVHFLKMKINQTI